MKNIVPRRGNTTYTAYSLFRQSVATNSNRPPLLLLCILFAGVTRCDQVWPMFANVIGNAVANDVEAAADATLHTTEVQHLTLGLWLYTVGKWRLRGVRSQHLDNI